MGHTLLANPSYFRELCSSSARLQVREDIPWVPMPWENGRLVITVTHDNSSINAFYSASCVSGSIYLKLLKVYLVIQSARPLYEEGIKACDMTKFHR